MEAIVAGQADGALNFPDADLPECYPHIGDELENGYTDEEMKMQNEGRRIFHRPELKVTCTCVRVPVMRSPRYPSRSRLSAALSWTRPELLSRHTRRAPYRRLSGTQLPTPLDTSDQELVWVGRVRRDLVDEDAITLWCCGDQIRKGAAANAVQILRAACRRQKVS